MDDIDDATVRLQPAGKEGADIVKTNTITRKAVFSSARSALLFFSLASMLQQLVVNGLFSVVVSTLERRFELQSTETGTIASVFGIAASVTTVFILFVPEDVHKARWYSRGTCLVGIGVLLFAMPHFCAPLYTISDSNDYNYCGNVTEPECNKSSSSRDYRYMFSLSVALMGAGSCFQHAYGISYLDENVSKDDSALYNSIFFAVTGFGAALGFVIGGFSLNWYTYITVSQEELPINNKSDLWIGAWWICYIIAAVATLVVAIPIHLFPRFLPGTEVFRENRDAEMQNVASARNSIQTRSFTRRRSDFTFLMRNKPYVLITIGSAVNCALIFGFNTFGAKYMETVFGTTPFQASLIYGACVVVASLTGQLAGGYFIKRMSLTVPGIIKFIIAGGICSAFCSFGFLIHCTDASVAGATVPYPTSNITETGPFSECNADCGCSLDKYQPVCHGDVLYFSPCYAGCTVQYNATRIIILMLGVVPGRLLVGVVMDLSCVSWGSQCGQRGSCRAYKRWSLARNNTILLVAQTVICAVLYICVYVTYEPAEGRVSSLNEDAMESVTPSVPTEKR